MKHRNVIVLAAIVVLALLIALPTLYMHSACESYLQNIQSVKAAIESRDFERAQAVFEGKLGKWEEENTMILAFSQHLATEKIKDYIVQLRHSLKRNEYDLALERADLLIAEIEHLQRSAYLIMENIF